MKSHAIIHRKIFTEAQKIGLTSEQPKILDYLWDHEGSEQKTIAVYCEIEPATLGSILLRMEQMEEKRTLANRLICYFIGLFIMTVGIAISVKSDLGVSPVSSIPYTLIRCWGIEMGKATILFHCVLVLLHNLGSVGIGTVMAAVLVGVVLGQITKFWVNT